MTNGLTTPCMNEYNLLLLKGLSGGTYGIINKMYTEKNDDSRPCNEVRTTDDGLCKQINAFLQNHTFNKLKKIRSPSIFFICSTCHRQFAFVCP